MRRGGGGGGTANNSSSRSNNTQKSNHNNNHNNNSSNNNNNTNANAAGAANKNAAAAAARLELPPVETVVARLETLSKLLHETSQTRLNHVFMEIQILADDLRKVGPYMESAYPDVLDRVMTSMRDASASSELPPALRLAVFELVELRAAKWILPSDTCNYYRQRRILKENGGTETTDLDLNDYQPIMQTQQQQQQQQSVAAVSDSSSDAVPAGSQQQQQQLQQKSFRQEILIKNSDSGKVMGVRGRRISKIEKLSDTIVSFEKVDPTAKERVLSINGYSQQSINLAKQLIQETIARNSSPVFDSTTSTTAVGIGGGGPPSPSNNNNNSNLLLLLGNNQDSLQHQQQQPSLLPTPPAASLQLLAELNNSLIVNNNGVGVVVTPNPTCQHSPLLLQDPMLLQGLAGLDYLNNNNAYTSSNHNSNNNVESDNSSNDMSLFNYTVNVGNQVLRVSGNNLNLVQEAKLALDDYFTEKYPQMFYTMHVRTRTTSLTNENHDNDDDDDDDGVVDEETLLSPTYNYVGGGGLLINNSSNSKRAEQEERSRSPIRIYNREQLLSFAKKNITAPDFSHLDPSVKEVIVLKKPRIFDGTTVHNKKKAINGSGSGSSSAASAAGVSLKK